MKRFLRGALSDAAYHALRLTHGGAAGLRILTYHRVTDAHPGDRLCVPIRRFEEQMRWLHEQGYRTVTLTEALIWEGGRWKVEGGTSERSVILTFDDGFEDNFTNAAPAMARYGFRGVFFVPSGFIASGANGCAPADRPMTWEQLQELLRAGHEIGAHSVTHRKLTRLSVEDAAWEVAESKRALERALGRGVEVFCYPSGDYDEPVKRAVAAGGYRGACTVEPGANHPGGDPYALKRTEVSAFDSLRDFEKKLAGAYDWLHGAVQRAGRVP